MEKVYAFFSEPWIYITILVLLIAIAILILIKYRLRLKNWFAEMLKPLNPVLIEAEEVDDTNLPAKIKKMFWLQPIYLLLVVPMIGYAVEVLGMLKFSSDNAFLIGMLFSLIISFLIFWKGMKPKDRKVSELKKKFIIEEEEFVKHLHYFEEMDLNIERTARKIAEFEKQKARTQDNEGATWPDHKEAKLQELIANKGLYQTTHDEFEKSVISPRKKDGKNHKVYEDKPSLAGESIVYIDKNPESPKIQGLGFLKMKMFDIKKDQVTDAHIYYIGSLIFSGLNFIFMLLGYGDKGVWMGTFMVTGISVLVLLAGLYLSKSFTTLEQTEAGLKLFLRIPFKDITAGFYFTPWGLVTINKLDMTIQYANIKVDKAYLTGEESQSVAFNPSQPWKINDIWKAITMLGLTMKVIRGKLEGKSEPGGICETGMIADKVRGVVRAWLADASYNPTLDDALIGRKSMESLIKGTLNREYGYWGIYFDNPNMPDIDPEAEIVKLRNETVQADQETKREEKRVEKEKKSALIVEEKAKGQAAKTELEGKAAANVIKLTGLADASAVKEMLKANVNAVAYLKGKGLATEAIPLITTMIMARQPITEIAKALQGIGINLYQIDGGQKIIEMIKSVTGLFGNSGTES